MSTYRHGGVSDGRADGVQGWRSARVAITLVVVLIVGIGAVQATFAALSGFPVSLNDFWGNLFIAQHLDLQEPMSFWNGFFPVGYGVILRAFGTHATTYASLLSILCGLVMLAAIGWLSATTLGPWWSVATVAATSLQPLLFRYSSTPSSDSFCAALFTLGVVALIAYGRRRDAGGGLALLVLGAAALGAAGLLRYHGLLAGLVFLTALCLLWLRTWRALALGAVVLFAAFVPQIVVSLWAGHSPLGSAAAVNVLNLTEGINWYRFKASSVPGSALSVVAHNPLGFIHNYGSYALSQLPYALPAVAWALVAHGKRDAMLSRALAVASLVYVLAVSVGASERGVLLLVPLQVWCAAATAHSLMSVVSRAQPRVVRQRLLAALVLVAVVLATWCHADVKWALQTRSRTATFAAVEQMVAGRVTDASQVFAADSDLYLPNVPGKRPRGNGGWERYATYGSSAQPDLPTTSLDAFLASMRAAKIRILVCGAGAGELMPELGDLRTGALTSPRLERLGERDGLVVFELR